MKEYENIFSKDVHKLKEITALYLELFKTRSTLHNELSSQQDPSTSSNNLLNSIVHLFFRKLIIIIGAFFPSYIFRIGGVPKALSLP